MAPVGRTEQHEVGAVAGREPAETVGAPEHVRRVDGARRQCLRRREPQLRRGERAAERQALAEGAARIEVGRERHRCARVDEGARRRHRPVEEERARRQHDPDDGARGERAHAVVSRGLEVVDRARAELDRERDRPLLGELVAVEAQREAGVPARFEVPARLRGVERAALEEDVRRLGEPCRLGQHLGEREVEVRVAVGELGRHRVSAEPGRDPTRGPDRAQGGELGVAVEAVARLRLERRRAVAEHPAAMALDRLPQAVLPGGPRRPDGREDAAAACVELLVAGARGAERELLDAVAAEGRVRVTVDEAGDRAAAGPVELDDLAVERGQVAHPPDGLDRVAAAEDVRVLEHVNRAERGAAQRCTGARRGRELRKVAEEQARRRAHASCGARGIFSPPRTAASIASG